ncbi:MAG TPA: preprotein translocase subunit SecE [Candidatus Paceibacterota bacterium]|jgi:preprotein translocase SecE subunit|nr:preprotein translocase subunit SecE [Candidatus Paceibacterota bacterium]
MANPLTRYLQETRTELNHVAWPTQRQTVVFTALVVALSLGVAAYVGALDYAFKGALIEVATLSGNANASNAVQQPVATSTATTGQNAVTGPTFGIPGLPAQSGTTPTPTK